MICWIFCVIVFIQTCSAEQLSWKMFSILSHLSQVDFVNCCFSLLVWIKWAKNFLLLFFFIKKCFFILQQNLFWVYWNEHTPFMYACDNLDRLSNSTASSGWFMWTWPLIIYQCLSTREPLRFQKGKTGTFHICIIKKNHYVQHIWMAAPVIYIYLNVVHVLCPVLLHIFKVWQAGTQVAS